MHKCVKIGAGPLAELASHPDTAPVQLDASGLDLGEVGDVVDQQEQVLARYVYVVPL
jgi:hypothetical protein